MIYSNALNQGQHNGDDDLLNLYEQRKSHGKNVGVGLGCRIKEWNGDQAKDHHLFFGCPVTFRASLLTFACISLVRTDFHLFFCFCGCDCFIDIC